MGNFVTPKMILVTLTLLWFGSPTLAQSTNSTDSRCATRILSNGACNQTSSVDVVDVTPCCELISKETQDDHECMCEEFTDSDFYMFFLSFCSAYFDVYIKFCRGTPPTSTTPTSDLFSPPPPDSSNTAFGSSPTSSDTASGISTIYTIIAIVVPVGTILVIIIIVVCICCIWKGRKKPVPSNTIHPHYNPYGEVRERDDDVLLTGMTRHKSVSIDVPPMSKIPLSSTLLKTGDSLHYDLATIQIATNNFSDDNKIGRGSFGPVYKGILSDGKEIAVKRLLDGKEVAKMRLSNGPGQGDKEFKAEIELLAKIQHNNVVRLLGYCMTNDEALLVYEFMPNKSLDYFLFDSTKRGELKWPMRFEIIKGIARGMLYVHEDCPLRIIHRDLKAANVLLDANMNPKIADFGTARICDLHQTHVVATRVLGTQGYMSPEYRLYKRFSVKSDVYALGVLILEIVSGRRIGGSFKQQSSGALSEDLMTSAWRCWGEDKALELTDPLLKDVISSGEVIKCVHLGLLCVQDEPNKRLSMSTIVNTLNSNYGTSDLPKPHSLAFLFDRTTDESIPSVTIQSTGGTTGTTNSSSGWSGYKSGR